MAHTPTAETRDQVHSFAAVGIAQDDIARVLGIDPKTLRKHYRDELDTAAIRANAAIGGALFNKAKRGDVTAQIWWTKVRMGWKADAGSDSSEDLVEALRALVAKLPA